MEALFSDLEPNSNYKYGVVIKVNDKKTQLIILDHNRLNSPDWNIIANTLKYIPVSLVNLRKAK